MKPIFVLTALVCFLKPQVCPGLLFIAHYGLVLCVTYVRAALMDGVISGKYWGPLGRQINCSTPCILKTAYCWILNTGGNWSLIDYSSNLSCDKFNSVWNNEQNHWTADVPPYCVLWKTIWFHLLAGEVALQIITIVCVCVNNLRSTQSDWLGALWPEFGSR